MAAVMTTMMAATMMSSATAVNGVATMTSIDGVATMTSAVATTTITISATIATAFDDIELGVKDDGLMVVQLDHPTLFAGLVNHHNHLLGIFGGHIVGDLLGDDAGRDTGINRRMFAFDLCPVELKVEMHYGSVVETYPIAVF